MSEIENRAIPPSAARDPQKIAYAYGDNSLGDFLAAVDSQAFIPFSSRASAFNSAAGDGRATLDRRVNSDNVNTLPFSIAARRLRESSVSPVLTRELLAAGGVLALVANDDPTIHVLSEAERAASLEAFMQFRPSGDIWVFAYGSLIWNPAMKTAERRIARVRGWRRTFCLSMTAGRGTRSLPGLALGLDRGEECLGVAYRIGEEDIASELPVLWGREMLLGGYTPQWIEAMGPDGEPFGHAISFMIDESHRNYAGDISPRAIIQRLATAAGSWGSAADYLFRTIEALRAHNIYDADLERVGALVEDAMSPSIWPQAA